MRGQLVERQGAMEIGIGAETLRFRHRRCLGRTPGHDQLRAELPGGDAQRTQDEGMFRCRWRRHDVAIDAANRTGCHHHRNGPAVELVVGRDHDTVHGIDGDPGIGKRELRSVVDHLLQ